MNDMVTIDVTDSPASTALVTITAALPAILAADTNDILGKLAAKVRAHKPDISTPRGRDAIRSLAAEIASNKVTLIRLGKALTEEARTKVKAVNAECNIIEEQMDALKAKVRQPLTDFENAEKDRVAGHEEALRRLEACAVMAPDATSEQISARIDALTGSEFPHRQWQEFTARASDLYAGILDILRNAHIAAVNREAEAAELARLRAEEVERQRIQGHQDALAGIAALAQFDGEPDDALSSRVIETRLSLMERLPQRAWEEYAGRADETIDQTVERLNALMTAAEAREAAALAVREAQIAAEATRAAEQKAAEAMAVAARKAERDRQVAAEAAARAETRRVQAHRAALGTMRRLGEPLEAPDPVPVIDAKLGQLADVYARDWEEVAVEAKAIHTTARNALHAAREVSVRLAEEAATQRVAETVRLERERVAAQEAEQRRQDEARAADVAHKGRILRQALEVMVEAMSGAHTGSAAEANEIAKAIISAIAIGKVPAISIKY